MGNMLESKHNRAAALPELTDSCRNLLMRTSPYTARKVAGTHLWIVHLVGETGKGSTG